MSRKLGQYPRKEFMATILVNPAKAKIMVLEAAERATGLRASIAYELNISVPTLFRVIRTLNLGPALKRIEERMRKEGTHHSLTSTEKKRRETFLKNGTWRGRKKVVHAPEPSAK
jgi:hypothetical protein